MCSPGALDPEPPGGDKDLVIEAAGLSPEATGLSPLMRTGLKAAPRPTPTKHLFDKPQNFSNSN